MNTLIQTHEPVRHALRSSGVLVVSLGLTVGVLVAVANVVSTWA